MVLKTEETGRFGINMSGNNMKTIKILGVLLIIVGSSHLIFKAKVIWWTSQSFFHPGSFMSTQEYIFHVLASILVLILLPLATLISGYGLFRIKKWGWILAMISCGTTFILSCIGTISFAIVSNKYRTIPMPNIPVDMHVETFSIWPTYIKVVISALFMFTLKRPSLRQEFNENITKEWTRTGYS